MQAGHVNLGLAHADQDGPVADYPERRRFQNGHLLIRIIGHGHNGTLDLVRRAARWRAPASGHRGKAAQKML
jgi:hypothetical protein